MRSLTICLLAGAMSAALIPAVSLAADAAGPKKATQPYKAPRGFDGHGDLSGVWTNVTITPMERPAAYKDRKALTPDEVKKLEGDAIGRFVEGNAPTDPNAPATDTTSKKCQGAGGLDCGYNSGWKDSGTRVMRVGGEPRTSFVTSTPDGRVPTPKGGAAGRGRGGPPVARPAVAESGGEGDNRPTRPGQNDNPESRGLGERCLLSFGNSAGPVMLPLMYNNNYQFVQTKDDVAILVEMVHDVRHIRIGATHLPANVRPWMGDSIGHWEGDTLVSETTNFPAAQTQSFRGASANLKVTEKFTRVGPNAVRYQFTVEDPTVWDAAWGGEYEFTPAPGQVYEYACHEGNYALEGILAGARAEEAAAKTASTARPAAR